MGEEDAFGPFVLDYSRRTLLQGGKPVALGQRGLALLNALMIADGGAVTKATLMEAGWPGSIVEEGNLTVQIAAIRKALGPREDGSDWIVTVPRVGYRLIASRNATKVPRHEDTATLLPSLTVMPFQNLSDDREQDYFAAGIVSDITAALSRFRAFSVITASCINYLDVQTSAGVERAAARYVLDGSVRRSGARLRISARLIDGTTGAHLWAQSYDGPVDDVFVVQDRITESVASTVEPMVKRAEIERARRKPPTSLDAYDLYLQALALALSTEPGANATATALIERSLAIDPHFAPAIAIAAQVSVARFDRQLPGTSEADRIMGLGYAHAALAAAGTDANTRAIAGRAIITLGNEFDSGIAALRRAVSENPSSVNVLSYAAVGELRGGDLDEAERLFLQAIRLNVSDLAGHWLFGGVAHVRIAQERYEEAVEWAARAHAASPTNDTALWFLIAANAKLGRMAEAKRWRQTLEELAPNANIRAIRRGQDLKDPKRIELIVDGLRLAGLREA